MAIQINEFEIAVEEPPPGRQRGGGDAEAPPPQPPAQMKPEEVVSAVRLGHERIERVRAD